LSSFKAAASSFGVEDIAASVRDISDVQSVIAAQAREPNSGLIVMPEAFAIAHRVEITALAARYRVPAIYPHRFFADLICLLSHGNDLTDNFRQAAGYTYPILKCVYQ